MKPPAVRLSVPAGGGGAVSHANVSQWLNTDLDGVRPALLVSFPYLENFLRFQGSLRGLYRDWALDSGAYTAHHSGKEIDLGEYTETALRLLEEDPLLTEVFALDDIADSGQSLRNTEAMWEAGVEAVPTFHYGEPEAVLEHLAATYPKIAAGGIARVKAGPRREWLGQVFARVWPKKVHGFGVSSEALLNAFPFHSTDASSWEYGPLGFGQWRTYGKLGVKPEKSAGWGPLLRVEVETYLRLERRVRERWAREMALLEEATTTHDEGRQT